MYRRLILLSLGLLSATPMFGQIFSKRVRERQEARKENYFYGAAFTITAGYTHSWLSKSNYTLSSTYFGRTAESKNTCDSWNIGFLYDQALSKKWGFQVGAYYIEKGGQIFSYYDGNLGYGPVVLEKEKMRATYLSVTGQARYFFPINYYTRISLNAGLHVDRALSRGSYYEGWDFGPQVGVGFDWKHLAASVTYQIGVYPNVLDNSKSRQSAICVNVGYRFWKD